MEERKITVVSTATQSKKVISTNAETLRDLKTALDEANIKYDNMSFLEGVSRTELISDESQLPSNVMYKGEPTNNLVIILTNAKKNISSGTYSRKEMYDFIKENNLGEDVKETYAKNYTQCSNGELEYYVAEHINVTKKAKSAASGKKSKPMDKKKETNTSDLNDVVFALKVIVAQLADKKIISSNIEEGLKKILEGTACINSIKEIEESEKTPYSNDELDDMIDNLI